MKKVILVATNTGKLENDDTKNNFFSTTGYDFDAIKKHCDEFVVYHSHDDKRVDFCE